MSGLAPKKPSRGRRASQVPSENSRVKAPPPQMLKAATYLMSLWSWMPSIREIRLLPPRPNRLPSAVSRLNQGDTRDTAATMAGSPSCPTKKVSARL